MVKQEGALREGVTDLMLDCRDPGSTTVQLEAVLGPTLASQERWAEQFASERRREQHLGRVLVDVVVDHIVFPHDETDELDVDGTEGLDRGDAVAREAVELCCRIYAESHGRTEVRAQQTCCRRGHHDLVRVRRVSHAPRDHAHTVLSETQAVDAGEDADVFERVG